MSKLLGRHRRFGAEPQEIALFSRAAVANRNSLLLVVGERNRVGDIRGGACFERAGGLRRVDGRSKIVGEHAHHDADGRVGTIHRDLSHGRVQRMRTDRGGQQQRGYHGARSAAHRDATATTISDTLTTRSRRAGHSTLGRFARAIAASMLRSMKARHNAAADRITICPSSIPTLKPNNGSAMCVTNMALRWLAKPAPCTSPNTPANTGR